jgi:hypothetical protein
MTEEVIDKLIVRKFDLVKQVGKGAYGVVWRAIDKSTHQTVAVKKCFEAFRSAIGMLDCIPKSRWDSQMLSEPTER